MFCLCKTKTDAVAKKASDVTKHLTKNSLNLCNVGLALSKRDKDISKRLVLCLPLDVQQELNKFNILHLFIFIYK